MNEIAVGYAKGRSCEGCTMCCKLLRIEALDKPRLQWCTHCDIGSGCKIYEERPSECRVFNCGYLTQAQFGEHWKPVKSKMVVALATNGKRLTIFVDPDRPDAWRKEPYYSEIKGWARSAAKNQGQVFVSQGWDMIVVTPDGETNFLGPVTDQQLMITRRKRASGGTELQHIIVDKDDPVLEALKLIQDDDAAKTATPDELADAQRQVDAWLARQDG
jgi:hypothetical protein